jgi:hypothetical protein
MQLILTPVPVRTSAIVLAGSSLWTRLTFQRSNASFHHTQCSMRAHREAWTPASTISTSNTTHNDDTTIRHLLRRCVRIVAFRCRLRHGRWCVLECEKRGHTVGLEALVQVIWRCFGNGRWAQQSGGGHPDVESGRNISWRVPRGS